MEIVKSLKMHFIYKILLWYRSSLFNMIISCPALQKIIGISKWKIHKKLPSGGAVAIDSTKAQKCCIKGKKIWNKNTAYLSLKNIRESNSYYWFK